MSLEKIGIDTNLKILKCTNIVCDEQALLKENKEHQDFLDE